jgi:hypothetical protein
VLRWSNRKAVGQALRYRTQDQRAHHPELVLGYFGSYAGGDWGVGSDPDLVAVFDDADEPFKQLALNLDLHGLPVPAEIVA